MTNGSDQMMLCESGGRPVKAWVDGSCRNNGDPDAVGGVGAVIKSADSENATEIYARTSIDEQVTSPRAEYLAVISALDRIEQEHSTDVVVYVYNDLETLVQQLQEECIVGESLEEFHQETQEFLDEFREWRVEHLSEEESRHIQRADELAKAAARGESI